MFAFQDRFYHYGLNSTSEELWHIPLTWTTENEQQFSNALPKAWMVKNRMKINDIALSQATSNNQWILFNINQTGNITVVIIFAELIKEIIFEVIFLWTITGVDQFGNKPEPLHKFIKNLFHI